MAMFSKRPASLAHLTDEAAARALSKHFGDVLKAAKDLGVDRKDLSKLTWSNPAILDSAHERMGLYIFVQRDEIIRGLHSRRGSERRRAIDRMAANPGLFGDLCHSPAFAFLLPAERPRRSFDDGGRAALDRGVAAERVIEQERERALELERERALRESVGRDQGVMVDRRAPAAALDLRPENRKYAHVRGLVRGQRR